MISYSLQTIIAYLQDRVKTGREKLPPIHMLIESHLEENHIEALFGKEIPLHYNNQIDQP